MQTTHSQWANWSKTDRSLTYQTGYLISVHNSRLDQCTQFQNYVSDISEHGFNFTRFREHSPCTWTQTKSWKSLHFPFICHLVLTAFKKKKIAVSMLSLSILAPPKCRLAYCNWPFTLRVYTGPAGGTGWVSHCTDGGQSLKHVYWNQAIKKNE